MKTLITWLASFFLAGIIISPFFWLRAVRAKSVSWYLTGSSLLTILFLVFYYAFLYDFLGDLTAKISADLYYLLYDAFDFAGYLVFLLIAIYPFIFAKIVYTKFSIKSFLLALLLSALIFVAYFFIFAYVIAPMAGGVLLRNI
jgi:hypothetical protein